MRISATGSDLGPSLREGRLAQGASRGGLTDRQDPPPLGYAESRIPEGGERGFTLIELMVVLVIIALASAAVAVSLPSGSAGLRQEATAFAARAVAARNAAIVGGRPVRVLADVSGFRVEERRAGRWLPWGGKAGRTKAWEPGTAMALDGAVAFDSTGLSDPATLRLERGGKAMAVRIEADGGVVIAG